MERAGEVFTYLIEIFKNHKLIKIFQKETYEGKIIYEENLFNDPMYILYSSGTTGKPKCIVHNTGGPLLQHIKEQQLHCDLKNR